MIAEFMNFYGMSFRETLDMPSTWFFRLYNRIRVVEARRAFKEVDISSYPHVDDRGRENIHKRFMIDSGYAKIQKEKEEKDGYSAGWGLLRKLSSQKIGSDISKDL